MDELTALYRKLLIEAHPDKGPESERTLRTILTQQINAAYKNKDLESLRHYSSTILPEVPADDAAPNPPTNSLEDFPIDPNALKRLVEYTLNLAAEERKAERERKAAEQEERYAWIYGTNGTPPPPSPDKKLPDWARQMMEGALSPPAKPAKPAQMTDLQLASLPDDQLLSYARKAYREDRRFWSHINNHYKTDDRWEERPKNITPLLYQYRVFLKSADKDGLGVRQWWK